MCKRASSRRRLYLPRLYSRGSTKVSTDQHASVQEIRKNIEKAKSKHGHVRYVEFVRYFVPLTTRPSTFPIHVLAPFPYIHSPTIYEYCQQSLLRKEPSASQVAP